jgi:1-acyl-sn-glycerol-3-phosphate acyltransferase
MKILLYLLAAVRIILIFGGMIMYMLIYGLSCLFKPHSKKRALNLRQHYLRYLCIPLLNIHIIKEGNPIDDFSALYVSNHRSFADPIVLCRFLKAFVIAKAEVMNYPIINKGAELTGVIWVNRQDQQSRNEARDKMVETIKAGFNILVYPEGTVGQAKETLPFRKGTFMEAAANDITVIPVAIEFKSPKDLWVIEKFVPQYFYQFSKWRTDVKLRFGDKITGSDGNKLHDQAYSWINMELKNMQKDWSISFGK